MVSRESGGQFPIREILRHVPVFTAVFTFSAGSGLNIPICNIPFDRRSLWGLACLVVLLPLLGVTPDADALTRNIPLRQLGVKETLYLPTVSSQQRVEFTLPPTWRISPGDSYLETEFQHSTELLPDRSWLEIIINEQSVRKIPLTRDNSKSTRVRVPFSGVPLRETNILKYRVEQHYTDKCEDPLDPSLWTQVLPSSHLVIAYTPVLPPVDLSAYPYPMIDSLAYDPAKVRFILPEKYTLSDLQAMTLLNVHLGQSSRKREIHPSLRFSGKGIEDSDNHLILVGTPTDNPEIKHFAGSVLNYRLIENRWAERDTSKAMPERAGLVLFFRHPDKPSRTVTLVTGNTPEGVLQAARFLTTRPRLAELKGTEYAVSENWKPSGNASRAVSRYIEQENRSFIELGFETRQVEKINAPPLTYAIPVVSDFSIASNEIDPPRMTLDLTYSYSPGLNPEFSSLELRFNDRAIANIPLENENGQDQVRTSVVVPNELIGTHNELVAQFHLLPDKYGFCVDNYEDRSWGIIHNDSRFSIGGNVASRLPDVGLVNSTGYPYTRTDNFEGLHVVIPEKATRNLLETVLAVTGRLGRVTLADTDLRLSLDHKLGVPLGRDILIFGTGDIPESARRPFLLNWPAPHAKLFHLDNTQAVRFSDDNLGAYLEQQFIPGNSRRVVTVITGRSPQAFNAVRQLFEDDTRFEAMTLGLIKQVEPWQMSVNTVNEPVPPPAPEPEKKGSLIRQFMDFLKANPLVGILGSVGLLLFFFIIPLILRRGKK